MGSVHLQEEAYLANRGATGLRSAADSVDGNAPSALNCALLDAPSSSIKPRLLLLPISELLPDTLPLEAESPYAPLLFPAAESMSLLSSAELSCFC